MIHVVLKLVLLVHVLYTYITVSSTALTSFSRFKCIDSPGRTPGLLDVIHQFGPLINSTPTAIGISAIQCASLCNLFTACQSYSYNPVNQYCFTRNVTLQHKGILCGIPVNESQENCKRPGDTFIAYGGENTAMMECICGVFTNGQWGPAAYNISQYNCIERCVNWYPCAVFIGPSACNFCNATVSACGGGTPVQDSNPKRMVCMPIHP